MNEYVKNLENRIDREGLSFYIVDSNKKRISSTWVIKRSIRKSDAAPNIYVYQKGLGGKMKLSLHDNRDCQWGMVGDYADNNKIKGFGTFAPLRWKRRITPDNGALYVASIRFVKKFLKGDFSKYLERKKATFCFEIVPECESVNFGIFYSKEDLKTLKDKFLGSETFPIFTFDLENGEFVTIAYKIQLNPYNLPGEFDGIKKVGQEIEPVLAKGQSLNNVSAVLVHQRPNEGTPIELVEVGGLKITK